MELTERQKQIIEVAIKLIAEHGIQHLTIKNIAEKIGVSEPALYRHFKNKFDILKAVIEYFKIKMQPAFEKLEEADGSLKGIENFILEHFEIFNLNHDLARVIFSESNFQNEEKLIIQLNRMMNYSRRILEDAINSGQISGEIRVDIDASSIVRIIIGSMRLLVTQWSMSDMVFDLKSEGKKLCRDLIVLIKE